MAERRRHERGTPARPWSLCTPCTLEPFLAWRDVRLDMSELVVVCAGQERRYHINCLLDLHEMLTVHGDWMPLGVSGEGARPRKGTVEAWARSGDNPRRGWYGVTLGRRGRFAAFIPPILVALRLAELDDEGGQASRMRALPRKPGACSTADSRARVAALRRGRVSGRRVASGKAEP